MNNKKLLIWDLDDTLIFTNSEFENTNRACAIIVSETATGNQGEVDSILKLHRQNDLALVAQYGFLSTRYLHSWLRTLRQLCEKHNTVPSGKVIQQLAAEIKNLYERKFENIPEALPVLLGLKKEGYRMVVLTAGEDLIQRKRIREAGVEEFMDAVYVYPYKTPDTLKEVLANYEGYECHMIGNSLKSDIHPALENGIWGIHAVRDTWEADHFDVDANHPLYRSVTNLIELSSLLKIIHGEEA